jgi:anthranilate synthase/aminodeoxychorismate synthase-like glutamine amidotransferase
MPARVLLLDNRDSFVWNLAQALAAVAVPGTDVDVVRSDRVADGDVEALLADRDAVVLSPGPGRPADAGALLPAVAACARGHIPVLGVCLGHQAIGEVFGARLVRGEPCHGETARIEHDGRGLFAGIPSPTAFARYHSLVLDRASVAAAGLVETAWTEDVRRDDGALQRVCMGVRHRELPIYGVQFHPESFLCVEQGRALLRTFLGHASIEAVA